ncbi:MAG TPA: hypothetical protein VHS31_01825, partial [Tepidisphaeraceae bacterium]|nr:hypothetical protein [Tepidisphaeraceae bacterium]
KHQRKAVPQERCRVEAFCGAMGYAGSLSVGHDGTESQGAWPKNEDALGYREPTGAEEWPRRAALYAAELFSPS